MRCSKRIAELFGAYIYGDLAPEEMRKVRLHVSACDDCARELQARSRTVALVPNALSKLTDEERHRVIWAVKGAVRARTGPRRFFLFTPEFARGFAVAALVAGAFYTGTVFGFKLKPARVVKQVIVKERPASAGDADNAAAARPDAEEGSGVLMASPHGSIVDPYNRQLEPIYRGSGGQRGSRGVDEQPGLLADDAQRWPWSKQVADDSAAPFWALPDGSGLEGTRQPDSAGSGSSPDSSRPDSE